MIFQLSAMSIYTGDNNVHEYWVNCFQISSILDTLIRARVHETESQCTGFACQIY